MYKALLILLKSWQESLKLFHPRHGKIFWLVTLKTIVTTIRQGWVFWVCGIWLLILSNCFLKENNVYVIIAGSPSILIQQLIVLSFLWMTRALGIWSAILIVRPSLLAKDYAYYMQYGRLFGIIFAGVALFNIIITISLFLPIPWIDYLFEHQFAIYYIPFLILFCFRAADTGPRDGYLKDVCKQASRIVVYNYPFLYIIACISLGGYVMVQSLLEYMSFIFNEYIQKSIEYGIFFGIFLCFACIVCNLYIQQVYAHFDFYIRTKRRFV